MMMKSLLRCLNSKNNNIEKILALIFLLGFTCIGCSNEEEVSYCEDNLICSVTLDPNPATSQTNLLFKSDASGLAGIKVLSMAGIVVIEKQVEIKNGENQFELTINSLQNGVFIVSLSFQDEEHNMKLVKK